MFPLPALPTDNLYKFFFIGGISMVALSVLIFFSQYNKTKEKLYSYQMSILKYDSDVENWHGDAREIKAELAHNDEVLEDTSHFRSQTDYDKIEERLKVLTTRTDQLIKIQREIVWAKKISPLNHEQLTDEQNHLTLIIWVTILFMLLGFCMIFYGCKKWYVLVQKPTDEKLRFELEQLKKSIQSTEIP